ncbi:MAG: NAD-dependent epimerase/dehydratase family protein [Synergistaceae bacterium]|nr:NAD-dependent epimerase/dehydratase family protein [Synergistaceae bacterium]
MKVLVSGGTGAMGNYLVKILADKGISVDVTTRQKRDSHIENVKYIQGDAHEISFMRPLMENGNYDSVIDFMIYNTNQFSERYEYLTGLTGHYVFFSSSRVYAASDSPIKETSPRLLDVSTDKKYLETDEYALTKARQENILMNGRASNWTIIRPYITYSNERLQLGVYEKERWLYRVIQGRPAVFSRDIAERFTTMTYGYDVAGAIAELAVNKNAFSQAYHITGDEALMWREIAEIYSEVFAQVTGHEMKIEYIDHALEDTAQWKYDRLYNRIFDNSKIKSAVKDFRPLSIREGLTKCLSEFLNDKHPFKGIDLVSEARMDRITKSRASMNELPDSFSGKA